MATLPSFEDLRVGMPHELPPVRFTQAMRDRHVELYGEDWHTDDLQAILERGIIPSTLVISVIGGLMGEHGPFRIRALKRQEVIFRRSVLVDDVITARGKITKLTPHRNTTRDYGYVTFQQTLFNDANDPTYERVQYYAVYLKRT